MFWYEDILTCEDNSDDWFEDETVDEQISYPSLWLVGSPPPQTDPSSRPYNSDPRPIFSEVLDAKPDGI
jgi:hypothetical protein